MIIKTGMIWFADAFTPLPWLIFIRPEWADDAPLVAHEMRHQDQMRRDGLVRWWWRYAFSKSWRQVYEVDAYRVQIAYGASLRVCAAHLAEKYGLDLTVQDAINLLEGRDG